MKKLLLLKPILLLFALIVGVGSAWADNVTDVLNQTLTGVTGTSYSNWSGKKSNSDAVYAGNSAGGNDAIQLRSNNSNSGIITTASGGKVKKITVTWNSNTQSGRTLNVYGKNSAYSSASDLYGNNAGTLLGTIVCGTSTELTITGDYQFVGLRSASGAMYLDKVEITWEKESSNLTLSDLALTGAPVALSFDLYNNSSDQTISYTTSSTGAVTVSENAYVTTSVNATDKTITVTPKAVTPEAQTITVSQAADDTYAAGSKTFTVTITNSDPNVPGTQNNPYTVAQAIAATPTSGTSANVYIKGIVSKFYNTSIVGDGSNYRYYISDDGTETNQLIVFKGKGLNNVAFSDADDLQLGDEIVILGGLTTYNNAPEVAANNYIVSLKRKQEANLAFSQDSYTVAIGGSLTITATSSNSDGDITYSSSATDVAEINATTGVVTAKKEGTTTITAEIAATENYKSNTATVVLTVTDNRAEAGIAWSQNEVRIELDAEDTDYTLPTLTNPNELTVSYSSSNEDVALIDEVTGDVILETSAEGTAVITATFEGNNDYKPGSASYTITIYDPSVKGTIDNPYTVEDLIDMGETPATSENVYVRGWIVGYLKSKTNLTTDPSEFNNTNIAIADNPSETDIDNVVAASFQNNSARTALNLKDNPWNLGVAQVLLYGGLSKNFGKVGLTSVLVSSKKIAEKVTVSSVGVGTYSTDVALDFSDSGITACTAVANGTSVALTEISGGIVPANAGVVLKVSGGATAVVPVVESNATLSENEMEPNVARALVAKDGADGKTNYILSNETAGVGFYLAAENGAYLPAHRAYLSTTTTGNAPFLGFDGEGTTGIINVNRETITNNQYYTLDGRRVENPSNGIYIVNGKKVVVK